MAVSVNSSITAMWAFMNEAQLLLADPPSPDIPLFHYADTNAICSIVGKQELWASSLRCMNDTRELEHGLRLLDEAFERGTHDADEEALYEQAMAHPNFTAATAFAISFSANGDLLSQWRAYANDGAGYAIGFARSSLMGVKPREWDTDGHTILMRVEYDEAEQRRFAKALVELAFQAIKMVKGKVNSSTATYLSMAFASYMLPFASMCKAEAFREEAEWRVAFRFIPAFLHSPTPTTLAFPKSSFRAARYGLTPYLTVPFAKSAIRTITRGPKLDQAVSEQTLRALLAQNEIEGWPAMALPHSRASYR